MKTWLIKYTQIPTSVFRAKNAKVEANTAEDARKLLEDSLGQVNGVTNFVIEEPIEYVRPPIEGRVVTLDMETNNLYAHMKEKAKA